MHPRYNHVCNGGIWNCRRVTPPCPGHSSPSHECEDSEKVIVPLKVALDHAFRRPTAWTIASMGSVGGSYKILGAGAGVLECKWGGEDKIYSFGYAVGGLSVGKSIADTVGFSWSTTSMAGLGSKIFSLPGTQNAYLWEAEFAGPIVILSGDLVMTGYSLVFLGSGPTNRWIIRAGVTNMALGGLLPILPLFKAVGVYAGMQGSSGPGISALAGELKH